MVVFPEVESVSYFAFSQVKYSQENLEKRIVVSKATLGYYLESQKILKIKC